MNRIKHLKASHSVSYETIKELALFEHLDHIIKFEITKRLAELMHNEFEMEFYTEENPFIGKSVTAHIVVIPVRDWDKIQRFLERNNFDFSEL